jgi:hypothetical protein
VVDSKGRDSIMLIRIGVEGIVDSCIVLFELGLLQGHYSCLTGLFIVHGNDGGVWKGKSVV